MCRSHQPDIDAKRTAASRTFEFLLFENPQQLWLHRQRKITYFIKEQCPCVSHFETADFPRNSPCKGALFMPKELAFQQVEANRRAIQLYEGALAARTEIMNGAGDQLLAGTRLAEHQHGGIGRCHSLYLHEGGFQTRAAAYDLFRFTFGISVFNCRRAAEIFHDRLQAPASHEPGASCASNT